VVDLSADTYRNQMDVTQEVLKEIGAGDKPSLFVFNKADLVKEVFLPKLLERSHVGSVVVSAFRPEDMMRTRNAIYDFFEQDMVEMEMVVPYQDTWLQSQIHEYSKVLQKEYLEDGAHFRIRVMRSTASWLQLQFQQRHLPAGS
jgi:GTP-binding protein HflX